MFKVGDVTKSRGGATVEILDILERPRYDLPSMVARVTYPDGSQSYGTYKTDGSCLAGATSSHDLLPVWTSFPLFGGIVMVRAAADGKMIVQWGPGGPPKFDPARAVYVARLAPGAEEEDRREAVVVHHLKSSGEYPGSLAVKVRDGDGHFLAICPDTGNHDNWLGRRWYIFNGGSVVVNVEGCTVVVHRNGNGLEAINLSI